MATISPDYTWNGDGRVLSVLWETMATDDEGAPLKRPEFPDKTVTITGALGTATSVDIEGSNDGTNWYVLADAQGNALSLATLNKAEVLLENPKYIRPHVQGGSGATDIDVRIECTRARGWSAR